jgi:hypothetical protein
LFSSPVWAHTGFAALPAENASVAATAWMRYVRNTLATAGILASLEKETGGGGCEELVARAGGLMSTALSTADFPAVACPANLRLCKCHPSSRLAKLQTLWQSVRVYNVRQEEQQQQEEEEQ